MTTKMARGPLMIDLAGPEMTAEERERLMHPLVGGVILFSRNYRDPEQLSALCAEIRRLRTPRLLLAIDHEGGRVQRCREGFTRLPAMRALGRWWDEDRIEALAAAAAIGFVLAVELRALGVDLSFAPVLDLDYGVSSVIGDRAFHRDPNAVAELAGALIEGMRRAGMAACGKHFPGHGAVAADSHLALPVDPRTREEMAEDLLPYRRLALPAVMLAHVLYSAVDSRPASFSRRWLDFLRREMEFSGAVFSDDLSMAGAETLGDVCARAEAAWEAGCDMLPVCNRPQEVMRLLDSWRPRPDPARDARVATLLGRAYPRDWRNVPLYRAGVSACARCV